MIDPSTAQWVTLSAAGLAIIVNGSNVGKLIHQAFNRIFRSNGESVKEVVVAPGWAAATLALLLVMLVSSGVSLFAGREPQLPEWPDSHPFVQEYGQDPLSESSHLTANGDRFMYYAGEYKIASACYVYDGVGDLLYAPQLQVSKAYDIRNSPIRMLAQWGPTFRGYLQTKKFVGMAHVVLLVPMGVDPGQFTTLRQAQAMGVKIVNGGIATFARS
jgi:hypothetical protein